MEYKLRINDKTSVKLRDEKVYKAFIEAEADFCYSEQLALFKAVYPKERKKAKDALEFRRLEFLTSGAYKNAIDFTII